MRTLVSRSLVMMGRRKRENGSYKWNLWFGDPDPTTEDGARDEEARELRVLARDWL